MRVISGKSKGRKLATLRGHSLRPTSDRVKETVFNILGGKVEGKIILDLFAGTGNLGIEALSRGARRAVFVEKARGALAIIRKNLFQFGLMKQSEIISKEVRRAIELLNKREERFDLILMDPPYERGWVKEALSHLADHKIYHEDSLLMVEHGRREPLPEQTDEWEVILERKIGDTVISFLKVRQPIKEEEEENGCKDKGRKEPNGKDSDLSGLL